MHYFILRIYVKNFEADENQLVSSKCSYGNEFYCLVNGLARFVSIQRITFHVLDRRFVTLTTPLKSWFKF